MILITGCGCSGTTYICNVLKNHGLKITHDKAPGRDGIVTNAVVDGEVWIYKYNYRGKYKDYEFTSITKGDIDFKDTKDSKSDKKTNKSDEEFITLLKDLLKEKVKDVKISQRLTSSASCLVADETFICRYLKL